jgi:hypothetical protein
MAEKDLLHRARELAAARNHKLLSMQLIQPLSKMPDTSLIWLLRSSTLRQAKEEMEKATPNKGGHLARQCSSPRKPRQK